MIKISNSSSIREMNTLLDSKKDLINLSPTKVNIEGEKAIKYTICLSNKKENKILNTSTVKYYIQVYVFDTRSNKYEIIDKVFKNMRKDKINTMKSEKRILKSCLMLMQNREQALFEIDKKILGELYDNQKQKFIERKKKEKEKELKDAAKEKAIIEVREEKERRKKNGEKNFFVPKKEIIIDQTLVEEVPSQYQLEEKLYYRIYIEDVLLEKIPFPTNASSLEKIVEYYNTEIRKLLEDGEIIEAESWCNKIINLIFNMPSGKVKSDYESSRFSEKRRRIEKEMKRPLLNLSYIYEVKYNKTKEIQIIYEGIKLIENTYYPKYEKCYDESYLKITGRLIKFYIKLKNFDKVDELIEIVEKNCSHLANTALVVEELKNLESIERKTELNLSIRQTKAKIKAANDESQVDYYWEVGLDEKELKEVLEREVNSIKKTMNLINEINH